MNYLSGALRYVAGGETEPANIIPRYIERLKTSALPHDRRAAIIQLTEAAKQSPSTQAQVGELGIKIFYAVLEQDVEYDDTVKATLDLLIAICATLDPPSTSPTSNKLSQDQFEKQSMTSASFNIDVFLGLPNALSLLLALLDKSDFYVKFGTIELLTAMAANSRLTLQAAMLEAPQAVARICDLLDDSHRHVRSNTVLLLSTLCDQSPEICKIVVFAGVLDKLFLLIETVLVDPSEDPALQPDDDIEEEDSFEAAIVVQDVLLVLRNLIRGTPSTRTFFRDSNSLPRISQVVKRSANDTGLILSDPSKTSTNNISTSIKAAITKQARKNLIVALQCVSGLAKGTDQESYNIKDGFAATNLFKTLVSLSFINSNTTDASQPDQIPENLLHIKTASLKTISLLIRGHDDFRNMFTSSTYGVAVGEETCSPQVLALRTILSDPSSAVRIAAYNALRESFVVDAGLNLPSSALLNALTGSSTTNAYTPGHTRQLSHGSLSSIGAESASSNNTMISIAESIKNCVVAWPNETDAAGVFYAASIIAWVVERVQGARERLLSSYANGNSLLPQIIRVLSKLEREKGPPEVRIALFSLACLWLHGSSSAVSAFLSFAMHLPMIVDILKSNGSRGDVAELHTRGLSSVLLGICLHVTDSDDFPESGFLSGGNGPSTVIPRGKIAEVIQNRIGITVFTASLDDLRSTREFATNENDINLWKTAENLIIQEERTGFLSKDGSLGHSNFYSPALIQVVEDVYKSVGAKALDLVAQPNAMSDTVGRSVTAYPDMNGHVPGLEAGGTQEKVITDSAKDEVINSYKEFIRSQDERYTAASRQIEELANALREAQTELETKRHSAAIDQQSDVLRELSANLNKTKAEKEELQTLFEEKNADFVALSEALAALEADQTSKDEATSMEKVDVMSTELQQLRAQNATMKGLLETETQKITELEKQNIMFQEEVEMRDVEIEAKNRQIVSLQSNSQPKVVEALQWKTRAEVAEDKLRSRQQLLDNTLNTKSELQEKFRVIENSRDDALSRVNILEQRLEEVKSELEMTKETRKRELQISRESSAMNSTSAKTEIMALQVELSETQNALATEKAKSANGSNPEEMKAFQALKEGHQALLGSFEQLKTELLDSRQATSQWQKRAEMIEAEKNRENFEVKRWADYAKNLEDQTRNLNLVLTEKSQEAENISLRVTELEQQCTELDDMRKQGEEEAKEIKEQLSTRTEQTIRLSGQLYELEESKAKLEDQIEQLQADLINSRSTAPVAIEERGVDSNTEGNLTEVVNELRTRTTELEAELEGTREALAESRDRESLNRAHAEDRQTAMSKAEALEVKVSEVERHSGELEERVQILTDQLLKKSSAEKDKENLETEIVILQKKLDEVIRERDGFREGNQRPEQQELNENTRQLQVQLDEKDLQIQQLKLSLTDTLDNKSVLEREKSDFEKQVVELNTMLSILQNERTSLTNEVEDLRRNVATVAQPTIPDVDVNVLQERLKETEKKYESASKELGSLVDACKLSEKESIRMQSEIRALDHSLAQKRDEVKALHNIFSDTNFNNEIGDYVSSITHNIALQTLEESLSWKESHTEREQLATAQRHEALCADIESFRRELTNLSHVDEEYKKSLQKCAEQDNTIRNLRSESESLRNSLRTMGEEMASLKTLTNQANQFNVDDKDTKEEARTESKQEETRTLHTSRETYSSSSHDQKEEPVSNSRPRIDELEIALRDAAKTVSATNKDLLAAQALLVELSADKTAIRIELDLAKKQIEELTKRVTSKSDETQDTAFSEVSEIEPPATTDVSTESNEPNTKDKITLDALRIAGIEADNLRMALGRTINEAGNASNLLKRIASQVELVESKLTVTETDLNKARQNEESIAQELSNCKQLFATEKQSLIEEKESLKLQLADQHESGQNSVKLINEELEALRVSSSSIQGDLEAKLKSTEHQLETKTKEYSSLRIEKDQLQVKVEQYVQQVEELEVSETSSAASITALNQELSRLKITLNATNLEKLQLKDSVDKKALELHEAKELLKAERIGLREEHDREVEELQDEIDKLQNNLEDIERTLQNTKATQEAQISSLTEKLEKVSSELADHVSELEVSQEILLRVTNEKNKQQEEFTDSLRNKDENIKQLSVKCDNTQSLLTQIRAENQNLENDVIRAKQDISMVQKQLEEAKEIQDMLMEEKQDLQEKIESLEQTSRRLREQSGNKDIELSQHRATILKYENEAKSTVQQIINMDENINAKKSEIANLESQKIALEEVEVTLKKKLEETEVSKSAVERDNDDLRAWVGDLERQATELQTAATEFEDVEQSLRDTLESQRFATDQNNKLVDEIRGYKEALALAETKARNALMEKAAAEGARDSSQRRANELEGRIRVIREENLTRYANSEEAIRDKARRCSELESQLASAERSVAELESVSDELFGVRAELKQRDEDLKILRERTNLTEKREESLEQELTKLKMNMSESNGLGREDSYRALEEEHNELLICLADLELECTTLKEELGRE